MLPKTWATRRLKHPLTNARFLLPSTTHKKQRCLALRVAGRVPNTVAGEAFDLRPEVTRYAVQVVLQCPCGRRSNPP